MRSGATRIVPDTLLYRANCAGTLIDRPPNAKFEAVWVGDQLHVALRLLATILDGEEIIVEDYMV